jgi:hypothetical protein
MSCFFECQLLRRIDVTLKSNELLVLLNRAMLHAFLIFVQFSLQELILELQVLNLRL